MKGSIQKKDREKMVTMHGCCGVQIDGNNGTGWECYRMQRMIAHAKEKDLLVQVRLNEIEVHSHHELLMHAQEKNEEQRHTSAKESSVGEVTDIVDEQSLLENDAWFSGLEDAVYVPSCVDESSSDEDISSINETENNEENEEEEEREEIDTEADEVGAKDNRVDSERDMEILRQHFLALLEKQPTSTTVKSKPQPQPKQPAGQTKKKKEGNATPLKGKVNKYEENEKKLKEKEREWATVPAVKRCTPSTCSSLTRDINLYTQQHSQTNKFLQRKQNLRSSLLAMLSLFWPGSSLHFFGSSCNGFGSDTSDVDLCALISREGRTGKRQAADFLWTMKRHMGKNMKHLHQLIFINARTPILKFYDSKNCCKCDLSVSNEMAIRNTHLLRTYANVDSRVRPLVLAIKRWASSRGINEACEGTLSSYAIVLMCIHFLQCGCSPPVLISLQKLYPQYFRLDSNINQMEKFEPWKSIPCNTSQNKETVGELFAGFFRYYCTKFSWETHVASVCEGRTLEKSTYRKFKGRMCVEDPLEYYNTARSVKTLYAYYLIRTEFHRVYKLTTDGVSFNQIVELKKGEVRKRIESKKDGTKDHNKGTNQVKQNGEVQNKEVTGGKSQEGDKKQVKIEEKELRKTGDKAKAAVQKEEHVKGQRQDKIQGKALNSDMAKENGKVGQMEAKVKNGNQHHPLPQGVKSVRGGYQAQRNQASSPKNVGRGAFQWNGRGISVNPHAKEPPLNWNLQAFSNGNSPTTSFGRGWGKNNSLLTNHPFMNNIGEKHNMVNGAISRNQHSSPVIPFDYYPGKKLFQSYQSMLETFNVKSGRYCPQYKCDKNADGSYCGSVSFLSRQHWLKSKLTSKTMKEALARAAYDALKTIPSVRDVKSMSHFNEHSCYSN